MNRVQRAIAEMTGRIKPNSILSAFNLKSFWGADQTVDYARSDYDLFKAVYYAAVYKKKGEEYLLGAGFAKPIINSTAAFTIGNGFRVSLDGADEGTPIEAAENEINDWIGKHVSDFYNLAKYGFRDGDAFMILHDDLSLEFADPSTVTVVYDPTNGGVIGYDIVETVDVTSTEKVTYKRIYRKSGYRVIKVNAQGEEIETVINVAFTTDGIVDVRQMIEDTKLDDEPFDGTFEQDDLIEVALPVFHYANELEPKSVYGISDIQNSLIYFAGYSKVLQEATKSNIYNSTPIPVIKGSKNSNALEQKNPDGTTKKNIQWGRNMVIYLEGDGADASFMNVPQTMSDTGALLEYYFYLIVQSSETPEFIFGAAMNSSKASASEQMPIMVKKAERKRSQLTRVLNQVIDAYIYKRFAQGDQNFYAVYTAKSAIGIDFPPIVDEDKNITLQTVNTLVEKGIISDRTALEMLTNVKDKTGELEQARKDDADRASRTDVFSNVGNRIDDELNGGGGGE
jgi:hypothetical protein